MKSRIALLIFVALISLTAVYAPRARGDESGQPASRQKTVKEVGVREARILIDEKKGSPGFVILDVRTDEEYSGGHIEGSTNIDVKSESFADEVGKLDKSKTYLVYCRSGKRSAAAVEIMEAEGFTDIYVMPGGILGWQGAGYPVTK